MNDLTRVTTIDRALTDPHLYPRLGPTLWGAFLRLLTATSEQPDVPGSLGWAGSMDDLAALLAVNTRKTAASTATRLEQHGLIVRVQGRSLGDRAGRLPGRIWVVYGGLPAPAGPNAPGSTSPSRTSPVSHYPVRTRDHLAVVPSQPAQISTTAAGNAYPVSDVNDETHHQSEQPSGTANPVLTAALARIGWTGAPPRDQQHEALLIAEWLYRQPSGRYRNPGGWLRRILATPGEASGFCAATGLYTEPTETPASSDTVMPYDQWVQREIDDPEWGHAVRVEAGRIAGQRGQPVTMLLVRTVAATWTGVAVREGNA